MTELTTSSYNTSPEGTYVRQKSFPRERNHFREEELVYATISARKILFLPHGGNSFLAKIFLPRGNISSLWKYFFLAGIFLFRGNICPWRNNSSPWKWFIFCGNVSSSYISIYTRKIFHRRNAFFLVEMFSSSRKIFLLQGNDFLLAEMISFSRK